MTLTERAWAYAFIGWIILTSVVYSALQTNVIWAVARCIHPIEWLHIWFVLSAALVCANIPRMWYVRNSPVAQLLLPLDAGVYAGSLWRGLTSGSGLTAVIGGVMWLTRGLTGFEPDWFLLWLGIVSAAALLWRESAKSSGRKFFT